MLPILATTPRDYDITLNSLTQQRWILPFTFIGMSRATPEKFQFSIKVPETVTHIKRRDIKKGAMTSFEEFLDKISPLKTVNKLGAILFQLPPSFTVSEFKNTEQFLDRLPTANDYDYAMEFRHPFGRLKARGKCSSITISQQRSYKKHTLLSPDNSN